ncbi:30S ribosomal protein S20 [bacterium]|nr:30S ribosomal protein S20 [bacterium]
MAKTDSAKKAKRSSDRKRVFNLRRKTTMKEAVKDARASKSDADISTAFQAIDKAVKRGVLKKNTAARMKSNLSKLSVKK